MKKLLALCAVAALVPVLALAQLKGVYTAPPPVSSGGGGGGGSPAAGSVGDLQTNADGSNFGAVTPASGIVTWLATPSGANLATALTTALPASKGGTGLTSLGTGIATWFGTPSSANLAAALTDETGTGAAVFATNPVLVTPNLGTPSAVTLTNGTGLPISTGVGGLGTGIATALGVNVGTAGSVVVNGGALGTPSSGTLTNATGLPISTGVSGLGTGIATWLATPSGANLASALTTGIPNSALANSGMTLAGHSVSLGSTQAFAASDLSNGVSGSGAVLLQNAGTMTGTWTGATLNLSGNITAANLTPSGTLTDGDVCKYTASGPTIDCNGPVSANVVTASATLTSGQLIAGGGTKTAAVTNLTGDVTTAGGVATTLATKLRTKSCDIAIGDTSGSAITNAQLGPQKRICFVPYASTVVEVDVGGDAGTPNVIVGVRPAADNTVSNLLSGALATAASGGIACSNTAGTTGLNGTTTCTNTLQNTSIAAGGYIELVSGTAGGTAKLMSVHVVYTIN